MNFGSGKILVPGQHEMLTFCVVLIFVFMGTGTTS